MNTVRFMIGTRCPLEQVELPQELGRWPFELFERHIADVAKILASDRCRVEPGGGEVAVQRKEARGLAPFGRDARCVADLIAQCSLLARIERRKSLAEAARSF